MNNFVNETNIYATQVKEKGRSKGWYPLIHYHIKGISGGVMVSKVEKQVLLSAHFIWPWATSDIWAKKKTLSKLLTYEKICLIKWRCLWQFCLWLGLLKVCFICTGPLIVLLRYYRQIITRDRFLRILSFFSSFGPLECKTKKWHLSYKSDYYYYYYYTALWYDT